MEKLFIVPVILLSWHTASSPVSKTGEIVRSIESCSDEESVAHASSFLAIEAQVHTGGLSSREDLSIEAVDQKHNEGSHPNADLKSHQLVRAFFHEHKASDFYAIGSRSRLWAQFGAQAGEQFFSVYDLLHITQTTRIVGGCVYAVVCGYSVACFLVAAGFLFAKRGQPVDPNPANVEQWRKYALLHVGRAVALTCGTAKNTIVGGQMFIEESFDMSLTEYNVLQGARTGAQLLGIAMFPFLLRYFGALPLVCVSGVLALVGVALQDVAMYTVSTTCLFVSGAVVCFAWAFVATVVSSIIFEVAAADEQSRQQAWWWFLQFLDVMAPLLVIPIFVDLWGLKEAYLVVDLVIGVLSLLNSVVFYMLSRGIRWGGAPDKKLDVNQDVKQLSRAIKMKSNTMRKAAIVLAYAVAFLLGNACTIFLPIVENFHYIVVDILHRSVNFIPLLFLLIIGALFTGCSICTLCDGFGQRMWFASFWFAFLALWLWRIGSFAGDPLTNFLIGASALLCPLICLSSIMPLLAPKEHLTSVSTVIAATYSISGIWSPPAFGHLEDASKGLGFKLLAAVSIGFAIVCIIFQFVQKAYAGNLANGTIKIDTAMRKELALTENNG